MKRGITSLVTAYLRARAAGAEHAAALGAVLHSYNGLSKEKQEDVWYRFQHSHDLSAGPPSNAGDLQGLIFSMLLAAKGPFDDTVGLWVSDQICAVMFDLQKQYNVRWD